MECPNNHGQMALEERPKEVLFRGKRINYRARHFVCSQCGIEADDLGLAVTNQKALSDAYRRAAKLLTGKQIIEGRKKVHYWEEKC